MQRPPWQQMRVLPGFLTLCPRRQTWIPRRKQRNVASSREQGPPRGGTEYDKGAMSRHSWVRLDSLGNHYGRRVLGLRDSGNKMPRRFSVATKVVHMYEDEGVVGIVVHAFHLFEVH